MIILLFSILWGGLLTLILCAPYGYYPLFYGVLVGSIAMYFVARKHFKVNNKYYYAGSAALFLFSYSVCTCIVFKPANLHFSSSAETVPGKKAVIFYCEGEMEKYTPYYANYFLEDTPLLLKPLYSLRIKQSYRSMGVNTKNMDLIKVATEVKTSLLNYKPYYFYIAFSGYVPGLKDSIHQAVSDGCGDITIINYSSDYNLEEKKWVKNILKDVSDKNCAIKVTKPVHSSKEFSKVFVSLINNLPMKFDGILIIDSENETSNSIKSELADFGYEDSNIVISENIYKAMDYFKDRDVKTVFYMNLKDSSSGLNVQSVTSKEIEKYSDTIKIMGKESWGYDKGYVKSAIEVLLEMEKVNR